MKKIINIIKILNDILRFNGIVINAPYPYEHLSHDGYFQRIKAIDLELKDIKKIYMYNFYNLKTNYTKSRAEKIKTSQDGKFYRLLDKNTRIIYSDTCITNILFNIIYIILSIKNKKFYFHGIFSITFIAKILLKLKIITSFLDIHGLAPEEGVILKKKNIEHITALEHFAISHMSYCITVTNSMKKHLEKKYRDTIKCRFINFPIFINLNIKNENSRQDKTKTTIIYSGGVQQWQEIPLMSSVIEKTFKEYEYKIYCSEPNYLKSLLSKDCVNAIELCLKPNDEVMLEYPKCHYGFALRNDNPVNNVACPTKLIEYLAFGIIPIMDTINVGDFEELGMKYIYYKDLLEGKLPNEDIRYQMALDNRKIYETLCDMSKESAKLLVSTLSE